MREAREAREQPDTQVPGRPVTRMEVPAGAGAMEVVEAPGGPEARVVLEVLASREQRVTVRL